MENKNTFLGTGWSFPPTFDKKTGGNLMVSDDEDIAQSLRLILFTSYGERIMRPTFGSNLKDSVFDSMDSVTVNTLTDNITQAIIEFEPRITLNEVIIEIYDHLIKCDPRFKFYDSLRDIISQCIYRN